MNNEYALKCLIQLSVESAREEINKIDFAELETILPQDKFNALFDRICTIDTTQKVIHTAIKELRDGNPEDHPPIDVDSIFNKAESVFRLFYLLTVYLSSWRCK